MPIYTPNGLKIRLRPEEVERILEPLMRYHSMEDILFDVETWEAMPIAISTVVVSAFAPLVAKWWDIIWIGVASYIVLHVVRGLTYSDAIRRVTRVCGFTPILILCLLGVPAYLAFAVGDYATALTLFAFNLAASFTALELLMLVFPMGRLRVHFGLAPTSQESAFIAVCNRRAKRVGIALHWSQYGDPQSWPHE